MPLFTMKSVSIYLNEQSVQLHLIFVSFTCTGDPYDIVKSSNENQSPLANWEAIPNLTPLNLYYDITPPELVSAVVTEVAILPCTSMCCFNTIFEGQKRFQKTL